MRSKFHWREAGVILAIRELQHGCATLVQAQANFVLNEANDVILRLDLMRAEAEADWEKATCPGSTLAPREHAGFSRRFEQSDRASGKAKDAVLDAREAQEKCRRSTQSSRLLLDLAQQTAKRANRHRQRALEERQWNAFEESARARGPIG